MVIVHQSGERVQKLTKKVFLVHGEDDISWSLITPELLKHVLSTYPEISLLDVSDFSYPRFREPPLWVIKKYSLRSGNKEAKGLIDSARVHKIRYRCSTNRSRIYSPELLEIDRSVESLFMTLFGDAKPQRHVLLEFLLRRSVTARAQALFLEASKYFLLGAETIVFIPNGRFPYQKAVELAANKAGAQIYYYERGFRPDRGFYLGEHPTQDRVSWQEKAAKFAEESSASHSLLEAKAWLQERRKPKSLSNEFVSYWSTSKGKKRLDLKFSTVFFTSSQDEFLALKGWEGFGWKDQYEAFDTFALNSKGSKCLRIHPNFVNKSFAHAFEEILRILWFSKRNPDTLFVWPNDPVNSYDLIQAASRIVVHGSTVGLEASADGKSVWNSGNAIYDTHADIRNFLPGSRYPFSFFQPWKVESKRALNIIQVMIDGDVPFSHGIRSPRWNSASIPLVVRLLNLLLVASVPYFFVLVSRSLSIRSNKILIAVAKATISCRSLFTQP